MTNQKAPIRIDIEHVDIYPAFIDYDFHNNRPRGGSCRIDFFSYGRLTGILEDVDAKPFVFVRKSNTFFENGMFLADFAVIESDPAQFVAMVKNLGITQMYLEESAAYPLEKARELLSDMEIVTVRFY